MLNVLFITADQWRGDCLSAVHHPVVATPQLDALARGGVLFRRHFANAAPCGPSRASLHTGLYLMNHRSGTNGTPLDDRHDNWARIMRAAGRDPVLFGYTDTSADPRGLAEDDPRRFTYEGTLPGLRPEVLLTEDVGPWAAWLETLGYEIPEPNYGLYRQRAEGPDWEAGAPHPRPLTLPAEHHDTAFMVDRLLAWIDGQAPGWTAHLSLLRPHPPWIAPEPWNRRYAPADIGGWRRAPTPEAEAEQHPWLAWQLGRRRFRAPETARQRRLQASYYGLMSEVDAQLGRLFAHLRTTGVWDDTFVLFTSDHGEQMGDHWLLGKGGYFDESYHVPLIVRDPRPESDGTRGRQVDAFTEHVDVMPTLLRALGLPVPPACDGRPLQPWLEGLTPERWRAAAHWEYDFRDVTDPSVELALDLPQHACNLAVLRDEHYKYVTFAGLPSLLFDLRDDPAELRDRSDDPAFRDVRLAMAERLLSLRLRHADQTLTHVKLTPAGVQARPAPRW